MNGEKKEGQKVFVILFIMFTQRLLYLAEAQVSFHAHHTYQTEDVTKVKDLETGMHGLHGRACWRHSQAYS